MSLLRRFVLDLGSSRLCQRTKSLPLLVLSLFWITGCEYLPHNPDLALSDDELTALRQAAIPADEGILSRFHDHTFVGLGDYHFNEEFMSYATSLVVSDEFVSRAQTVIVEFGNAKFQPLLDSYIAGEQVSRGEMLNVLRGSVFFTAWMPDVYADFFTAVRKANLSRPAHLQIKVVLAEQAFDWQQVKDSEQWQQAASNKVDGFFATVEKVIKSQQKALLIFGAFHLLRIPEGVSKALPDNELTLASRLLRHYPGALYSVWPMAQPEIIEALQPLSGKRLIDAQQPPFSALRFIDLMPKARYRLGKIDSRNAPVSALFDAMLYVGPTQRRTLFPKAVIDERLWVDEMKRRVQLMGGPLESKFTQILAESEQFYR
ncbi:hypothetical protein EZV61_09125 [Corallincola luteus]|uniref:Uncharacterized protein n=1 Tax=Corallincola luteus TaxID=1775177 RepID=A0ABY2APM0_9GAMM|nr:hypothetical protein [Corallincola luteus]TCI03696.1 hypothetical protein EZV61_09125 [Corallincola luteus]